MLEETYPPKLARLRFRPMTHQRKTKLFPISLLARFGFDQTLLVLVAPQMQRFAETSRCNS
jgi:hypothetical protein